MLLRRCRPSVAFCAFATCVVVAAGLLLPALLVQARHDSTLAFLQEFRRHTEGLESVWPQSDSDYCTWPRVLCSATTRLASLDLSELNLEGEFPEVKRLDGSKILIESINMSFNPNFHDSLCDDWGKLSSLRVLDLSSTDVAGDLPDGWRNLRNLEFLNLSNTRVDDNIPDDWKDLSNLVVLDLHSTKVNGMDVKKLGPTMTRLEVLLLSHTAVGDVLDDLTEPSYFPSLRVLDVSYPVKTSTELLPPRLASWAIGLANLMRVDFEGYNFTGCVPDSYRSVPVLMQAARRANIGLVMSKPSCSAYTCNSPRTLSENTWAFLEILRSSPFMMSAANASLWAGDDYCSWQGVACPAVCGAGISIDLSSLPLSGAIPDAFVALKGETVLIDAFVIRDNAGVVGTLPPSLATALSLARRVELSSLAILGTLPDAFGSSLRYVEHLAITHTRLCGPLPNWDTVFYPPLRNADLSDNRMGGTLPSSWAALPLTKLNLRRNHFCGCVPDTWLDKPLLLRALDNAVVAAATTASCDFLNGCGNLNQQCDSAEDAPASNDIAEFLQVLRSSFPAQLSSWGASADYCDGTWRGITCNETACGAQEVLINLSGAQFDGTLPNLPANVVGSRVLVASINMADNPGLTGSLPVSWGRLSYLRTLNLNNCGIQGDLPEAWMDMSSLETLLIAGSKLCRGLPSWSAESMPNLKHFDTSANAMYGGLSASFGSFGPQLKYFNVTKNKFCGCIPDSWKAYHVLMVGVDNDAATSRCALSTNTCGRYAMRCEPINDTILNFKDVNWHFLDVMRKHLSVDLDEATSSKAIAMFATWSSYDFCEYAGVSCRFHEGSNGFTLSLEGVGLKGTLPSISSNFKSAVATQAIDLSDNPWITGTLPPSWGELTNLLYLDLSGTSVESAIPASWQGMHNLLYLSVARTLVCGALPPWSADALVSVRFLDFSHSKLAGTLSNEWGAFSGSGLYTLKLKGNAGLCSCAPSEWLDGQVLPYALVNAFGTIPQISDTCASICSSPPSCVKPETEDSHDGLLGPHGALSFHLPAMLVIALLIW